MEITKETSLDLSEMPKNENNEFVIKLGDGKKKAIQVFKLKEKCFNSHEEDIKKDLKKMDYELDKDNIVNYSGQIFEFKGHKIDVFVDNDGEIWIKGLLLTELFGYKDPIKSIRNIVSLKNKEIYKNLMKKNGKTYSVDQKVSNNYLNSMFVNMSGIFELCGKSRLKSSQEFTYWVNNEVLPSINKKGYFSLDQKSDITKFKQDDDSYVEFIKNNLLLDYKEKSVIYLLYIGRVIEEGIDSSFVKNEIAFKFGVSERVYERDNEHKFNIDDAIMFYVKKCVNYRRLEADLKKEFKSKGLLRNCVFNKHNYTELFTISDTFTIENVYEFIDKWICTYDHDALKLTVADEIKLKELEIESKKLDLECKKLDVECKKYDSISKEIELLKLKKEYGLLDFTKNNTTVELIKKDNNIEKFEEEPELKNNNDIKNSENKDDNNLIDDIENISDDSTEPTEPINKKHKNIHKKDILYKKEQTEIIKKLDKLFNIKQKTTSNIYYDDVYLNKNKIIELIKDIKKYFITGTWSYFKNSDNDKGLIYLLKSIYKYVDRNVKQTYIIKNGEKINVLRVKMT